MSFPPRRPYNDDDEKTPSNSKSSSTNRSSRNHNNNGGGSLWGVALGVLGVVASMGIGYLIGSEVSKLESENEQRNRNQQRNRGNTNNINSRQTHPATTHSQNHTLHSQSQPLNIANIPPATTREAELTNVLEEALLCKVCLVNELNSVLLPCSHQTVCTECASKLYECPLCRSQIDQVVRIYRG